MKTTTRRLKNIVLKFITISLDILIELNDIYYENINRYAIYLIKKQKQNLLYILAV